ncbi:MAG TPA: DUF3800 domain-containing protein [Sedimentisphaerales bacterium]|nr:DUF3800 domain-containing protein [Sedimentisphaerales bacterium]
MQYTVISVCLDKKKHKETYTQWRYDPYHYCLAILLERYVLFLQRTGARGDAMAESRGGREDRRLKDSFNRLYEKGTDYLHTDDFQATLTSKQLKVKSKANNIFGLQLADLLAHPSRNEILYDQDLLNTKLAPFAKLIIQILQTKYDRQSDRIYGKKFI